MNPTPHLDHGFGVTSGAKLISYVNSRLLLSIVALVLTMLAWLWLAMCFTATYAAWWNSIGAFVALFGLAFVIALGSAFVRGTPAEMVMALGVCVWSALCFGVVLILAIP